MEDFRLKVFYSVAKNQSFTKAANELFITQPAITKHIKTLEQSLGLRLFNRKGNSIILTQPGEVLFRYATKIFAIYQEALTELTLYKNEISGYLRLGASTTIAQYLIAPVLASFHEKFPNIKLNLLNGNTETIENAILSNRIDLGIVEGRKHHTGIKYIDFTEDELVAVVHSKSRLSVLKEITLDELMTIPMVLREQGSGTLDVLNSALNDCGIKLSDLQVIMYLGSTESIKSFLEYSNCLSFMSVKALEKEVASGQLKIISIKGLTLKRRFSFIHLQGHTEGVSESFIRFAFRNYN
jgi:DNA-binding transcriptional LysR family regulator